MLRKPGTICQLYRRLVLMERRPLTLSSKPQKTLFDSNPTNLPSTIYFIWFQIFARFFPASSHIRLLPPFAVHPHRKPSLLSASPVHFSLKVNLNRTRSFLLSEITCDGHQFIATIEMRKFNEFNEDSHRDNVPVNASPNEKRWRREKKSRLQPPIVIIF